MSVTVDIKVLAFIVIAIALVVLIVYLIQLMRKLLVTVEHTNKILKDVEVVSAIVSERSKDVDGIIGDVTDSVSAFAEAVKGRQNIVAAIASLAKSIAMLGKAASENKEKSVEG